MTDGFFEIWMFVSVILALTGCVGLLIGAIMAIWL